MAIGRLIRGSVVTLLVLLALPAAAGAARSLYVTNGTAADNISIFDVAAGAPAAPTAGVTTPVPEPSGDPRAAAMSPDGEHLYVGSTGSSAIVPHTVAANGALTVQPPVAAGSFPSGITVTADGRFLYVANAGDDTISAYAVGAGGALTELASSPFSTGASPFGIASSPDGENLYVTNGNGASVGAYDIGAGGALTELAASPYATGGSARGVSITPDGGFLYVANNGSDNVSGYAVAADGSLTPLAGSPFGTAQGPFGTAISPDGKHLLLTSSGVVGAAVSMTIGANGALSSPVTAPAGQSTRTIAVHPNGADAYLTADTPNQLFSYTVAASGALAPLGTPQALPNGNQQFQDAVVTPNQGPTAAFSQGTTPASVVATFNASASSDPDGAVVSYVWNFGDGTGTTTDLPTVSHKYASNGTYAVSLRVVDDEGCSTARVYTGQTALCNGSGAARVTKSIDTKPGKKPNNRVKNPQLKLKPHQRQKRHKIKVIAKVGAGETANVKLSGFIKKAGTKISLGKQSVRVKGTNRKQVELTVKKRKGTKRALALLRKAGALRATVKAKYRDNDRNKAQLSNNTTLLPKKRG